MLRDDDELPPHRDPFLKNFLEEERRRTGGPAEERKGELRIFIGIRESELADVNNMWRRFEQHLHSLPDEQRPGNEPLKAIAFVDWKNSQESELNGWKEELANLEGQPIDGQLVFNNARDRLLRLFEAEAREAGLLPQRRIRETPLQTPVEEPSLKEDLSQKSDRIVSVDSESRTRHSRLAKGQRIPQKEFIKPILEALVELDGSAR